MNMDVYIGIDLGSSGIKAVALDDAGKCVAAAKQPMQICTGPGGKAEQSPSTWHDLAGKCLRQLSAELKEKSYRPAAAAATGQMDGAVLLDANGQAHHPVQMWCDSRCAPQCSQIDSLIPPQHLLEITGHSAATGYTAPKLLWLAENTPEILETASQFIFPKDYITKILTGNIGTDFSDASNSLLLDIRNAKWSDDIIGSLGLESLKFPKLLNSSDIAGRISPEGAKFSGLPEGLPIAAGAGDSIATALGSAMIDSSQIQIVIGTAGNVNCVLTQLAIDTHGRVHTGYFVDDHHWICSGVQQSSGVCLDWWSRITGLEISQLIGEVDFDSCGSAVLFAPYLAGERTPYLDPYVRGAFAVLDRNTKRKDMTRAIMEGVAFSFKDAFEVFANMGIFPSRTIVSGGGAGSDDWCAILAAVMGLAVERVISDTTARGAAILAACAAGRFEKWQQAASQWPIHGDEFTADQAKILLYYEAYSAFKKLYPSLAKLPSNY